MSTRTNSRTDRQAAALRELAQFPLLDALYGRRARRISLGSTIPDGPLAYESPHDPVPLSELERMVVLTSMAGTTGWHYSITRNAAYAGHMANYAAGAAGRTFPSAAGFHTAELFFTDDSGTYAFPTRDAGALVDPAEEDVTVELMLRRRAERIVKLDDRGIECPREEPYYEGHNTWGVNVPGSLLAFPVGDLAQHTLAGMMFLTQNGYCLTDDVNGRPIPGMDRFRGLVDVDDPFPLSFFDQYMLAEITAELATSCYAGVLVLQAMGLGGWMFDGIDRFSMLGASGEPDYPGLGFRYDDDDMRAAVDALCDRKFGNGGPHNADTPGAWTESALVRSSAQVHDERFRECVATQAQYLYGTFGKFPATVPSVMILNYLQAHHLDLDFYDQKLRPGSYLETHARHMEVW